MLVDKSKTERLDIPHEPGEWIDIRAVTGAELDESGDQVTTKVVHQFADQLSSILSARRDPDQKKSSDRKAGYDPAILLNYAITAWSYPVPVTKDSIALLDGKTRDWIWEEVVNRNTIPPTS